MSRDLDQAEKAFVGCLLRSPNEAMQCGLVTPDMIRAPYLRRIYEEILKLTHAQQSVSVSLLQSHLPKEFEGLGPTVSLLAALKEHAEEAGPASDYGDLLIERESQRRLAEINEWTAKEVRRGERPPEAIASDAARKLQDVMELASPVRRQKLGVAAARAMERASKSADGDQSSAPGLPTGIAALDGIVGRLFGLTFIIASQGEGKSALATQIAVNSAETRRPALVFQFEMDAEEMGAREIAARSGLPVQAVTEPQGDVFDRQVIAQAVRDLSDLPLYIVDTDGLTVRQIGAQAKAMERTTGLSLVVIDQLDKIKSETKHRDRFERLAEITLDLKNLSKSMPGVVFLVLGQRTRGAQRRDDPTPEVNDADAPSIERDADVIVGLWFPINWLRRQRPKKNVSEEMDKWESEMRRADKKAEAIILKHRRRKAFAQCEMRFDGDRMRFGDFVQ